MYLVQRYFASDEITIISYLVSRRLFKFYELYSQTEFLCNYIYMSLHAVLLLLMIRINTQCGKHRLENTEL